ncbi:hypothetical protein J6590_016370 [Homalodisca vitripennis]|nr:hypothetical protein J6590_016370 [Homalodisca vitripennis]
METCTRRNEVPGQHVGTLDRVARLIGAMETCTRRNEVPGQHVGTLDRVAGVIGAIENCVRRDEVLGQRVCRLDRVAGVVIGVMKSVNNPPCPVVISAASYSYSPFTAISMLPSVPGSNPNPNPSADVAVTLPRDRLGRDCPLIISGSRRSINQQPIKSTLPSNHSGPNTSDERGLALNSETVLCRPGHIFISKKEIDVVKSKEKGYGKDSMKGAKTRMRWKRAKARML